MLRSIQPELLDTLPPHHPDALHSRRDLRLINRIMGNHRWLRRTLEQRAHPGERILEIGAGTGEFPLCMLQRGVAIDGLDLWPEPARWPRQLTWHSADLRTFGGYSDYSVVVGNLIFHQFNDADLAALGRAIRLQARLIVACEPARRPSSQTLFRTVAPIFGANRVTLHDGRISIEAGFRANELAETLGVASSDWSIECETGILGGYHLIATRRS